MKPFTLSATIKNYKLHSKYIIGACILMATAISCKKGSDPSNPPEPPAVVPDSVVLSHWENGQWKLAYTYRLDADDANHIYTVQETDHTTAPLPLQMTKKKFYLSADGKKVERIFSQLYAVHTGFPPIGVASVSVIMHHAGNRLTPDQILVESHTDVDGNSPGESDIILNAHTDETLIKPFDVRTRTTVPVLPSRTESKEYTLQFREDSLLHVQGDFDLDRSYFSGIISDFYGVEEYFNYFRFGGDSACDEYVFDKCWTEVVPQPNSAEYIYHPMGRKKLNFTYGAHAKGLAAIFSRLDPAWFFPYKTMIHSYTFDDIAPRKSTRTFFENISSIYTDSVFTFTKEGVKSLHSSKRFENVVTLDAKQRISTVEKQANVNTEQRTRYEFFYKD